MKEGLIRVANVIGILAGAFGIFVGSVGALFSTDLGAGLFSLLIAAIGISAIVISIKNIEAFGLISSWEFLIPSWIIQWLEKDLN